MAKQYLTLGIDHGTSNSGIAVMEDGRPRVVKVNMVDETMPSVVYIDKRGRVVVGAAAYRAMMINDASDGNGYSGYKLRIGQDELYDFTASNIKKSAQELGAIVIGTLARAYQEESGEAPIGAVITVPAKFEHSACEGTRMAAQKAGLRFYPLLQEPIAAALGYGFSAQNDHARYMVFDLGGGTFDVSLVFVRDGDMFVPEEGHAGDTRLGGRIFDRKIMDYALQELGKTYKLDGFSENNDYRQAWGKLYIACEQAKIMLSTREEAVIEVDSVLCRDGNGKDVNVEVPISRDQYEAMIEADVEKTIHICRSLLECNRISAQDLDSLLLVGGPTKTPLVRKALSEALEIQVETSVDPMTAVACGAAVYASSQELPDELKLETDVAPDATTVKLEYERVSKLPTSFVAGKVEGPAIAEGNLNVEISRNDGRWSSGMVPVDEEGYFETDLVLDDPGGPAMSKFATKVMNGAGAIVASSDEPEIWFRYPEGKARLANSLRVAVAGNATEILVKQGTSLPAEGFERFVTQKTIRQGSAEDVLHINVLEGVTHLFGQEDDCADCNVLVGALQIHGGDEKLKLDLPENSEIEVTVRQDASRVVSCVAFIPLLEEEFDVTFSRESFKADPEVVKKRYAALCEQLKESEKLQRTVPLDGLREKLETIRRLRIVDEIEKDLARSDQGETEAFHRAYKQVLELAGTLNQVRDMQREARIQQRIDELDAAVDGKEAEELEEIRKEFTLAAQNKNGMALKKIEESLNELDVRVRQRPFIELILDITALSGMRVNMEQKAAFEEADALLGRIHKKGGADKLTDNDLRQLTQSHEKLARLFTDLQERRQKVLNDLPKGQDPADLGRDLKKA